MDLDDIRLAKAVLPSEMPFPYWPGREAAWLLHAAMPQEATVADLRRGAQGRWLSRAPVAEVVAASGGRLTRADIAAVALPPDGQQLSAAGEVGLRSVLQGWRDYTLSLDAWPGERFPDDDWQWNQTSRRGHSLVVQVNFPGAHARLMAQHLPKHARQKFEFSQHPVRGRNSPTMAWVRMDIEGDEALIEEVQSDWFRAVAWRAETLARHEPRSRELRSLKTYEARLTEAYKRGWEKVALLAALTLLRGEFGVRRVFLHRPETGVKLKSIYGTPPPRSIYTALPKAFGFGLTRDAPGFLERPQKKTLAKLRNSGGPIFWDLDFAALG